MKRVLFIIPVLARGESDRRLLHRLLSSIKKFDPLMMPHTLVVEEFASVGVTDMCQSFGCTYIHKHLPPGYATSINLGIKFASEKNYTHVVTINSDIEFTKSLLVPIVRAFSYGDIIGGTLWYPTGKIQSAGWEYRDDCIPIETEKGVSFQSATLYKKERFVGGITGALQGFSLECGLYDDKFFLSYEDVEFCVRNLLEGRKIFYTPTIEAVHVESATRGYFLGIGELKSFKRYSEIVEEKNLTGTYLNSIVEEYNKVYERQMG
jgi:GT2 family glycosyltransferase